MRRLEQNKGGCSVSDQGCHHSSTHNYLPILNVTACCLLLDLVEAADPGGWVLTLSDLGKCWGDKQKSGRVQVSVIQMIGSIVCLSCGPVAGADGAINMSQCSPRPDLIIAHQYSLLFVAHRIMVSTKLSLWDHQACFDRGTNIYPSILKCSAQAKPLKGKLRAKKY